MEVCLLITFPGHTASLPKTEAKVKWSREGRWGFKVQGNRFDYIYAYMTGMLLFLGDGLFSGICVYMCTYVCTYTTYIYIHTATLHTLKILKMNQYTRKKKNQNRYLRYAYPKMGQKSLLSFQVSLVNAKERIR